MILRPLAFYAVTLIATTFRLAARFPLTHSGLWVVRLVHLRRAPAGEVAADWESFWAACTFGVK